MWGMGMVWAWLVHVMGVDYQARYGHWVWYSFWSGFGSLGLLASFLAAPLIFYRKHNCHVHHCWRLGRHDWADPQTGLTHPLCRVHHPGHPGTPLTADHVASAGGD